MSQGALPGPPGSAPDAFFEFDNEGSLKMTTGKRLAGLLLLTTALAWPGVGLAQETGPGAQNTAADQEGAAQPGESAPPEEAPPEDTDISVPGGAIIVTGRVTRDPTRNSSQVLSVLSTEQIARTGEGNIAGALGRVTGLSV